METTKKKDFIEILYTGYTNGNVFDSNIPEDLKKIDPRAEPKKTILVIGEGMVVPGLDKALEGKEINKEYKISLLAKDAFGPRDRSLLKTIPLKVFTEKNIDPKPGMVLALDTSLAKILTISGARVITDFNNPLAGKDVDYKFKIIRVLSDEKEKAISLLEQLFRFTPDFEIKEKDLIVKGPKTFEVFISAFKDKVKEIMGMELKFEEKKEEKKTENKDEAGEEKKIKEEKRIEKKKEKNDQNNTGNKDEKKETKNNDSKEVKIEKS